MAEIKIYYSPRSFDNILATIKAARYYTADEKNVLSQMLSQMQQEDWLLYMVDIYQEQQFAFPIPNFPRFKTYLANEVYGELTSQLLKKYINYEEIEYSAIRKWFDGMTIDADFIKILESRFKDIGVNILY